MCPEVGKKWNVALGRQFLSDGTHKEHGPSRGEDPADGTGGKGAHSHDCQQPGKRMA